jgi:hypothetical protein
VHVESSIDAEDSEIEQIKNLEIRGFQKLDFPQKM